MTRELATRICERILQMHYAVHAAPVVTEEMVGYVMLQTMPEPTPPPPVPEPRPRPLEGLAKELLDHMGEIESATHWVRWRRKHARTLAALFKALPDSPTRRTLVARSKEMKRRFGP